MTPAKLALLYEDQQRLEEAVAATNAAIAADPRLHRCTSFEGLLLEASGRPAAVPSTAHGNSMRRIRSWHTR